PRAMLYGSIGQGYLLTLFPPSPTHSFSSQQTASKQTQTNTHSTNVGTPTVVHHTVGPLSSTSHQTSKQTRPVNATQTTDQSPQSSNLAPEVLEFGYLNLPNECM
ncbi:hypothetical protein NDU88_007171, partial [Pleurodeles waltl]